MEKIIKKKVQAVNIIKLRNGVIVDLKNDVYIVQFILLRETYNCIWYSDNEDLFLLHENNLLFFEEINQLELFCKQHSLNVATEISVYDLDILIEWLKGSHNQTDCDYLLRVWNIMSDFSKSLNVKFSDSSDELDEIYRKLFFGNNLPCVNLTNKKYIPNFSEKQLQLLSNLFDQGLSIIKKEFQVDL